MEERRGKIKKEEEILIAFLKRTKDGEYATIEESSLPYARMKEETESVEAYGDYYYGIS
jgi:hypothetical protein